jgi:hypothetical protein
MSSKSHQIALALCVLCFVMLAFWSSWFLDRSLVASSSAFYYVQFENAFPLADGFLTMCMALGAWSLWRPNGRALLWLLLGSGAGLYLAGMDVLFDIEHAIWWRHGAGGIIELAINVVTVLASVGLARWTWRQRHELLNQ